MRSIVVHISVHNYLIMYRKLSSSQIHWWKYAGKTTPSIQHWPLETETIKKCRIYLPFRIHTQNQCWKCSVTGPCMQTLGGVCDPVWILDLYSDICVLKPCLDDMILALSRDKILVPCHTMRHILLRHLSTARSQMHFSLRSSVVPAENTQRKRENLASGGAKPSAPFPLSTSSSVLPLLAMCHIRGIWEGTW